ncbi:MAG TPA: GNAT family N-acetyltransferase [Anaerolineaceae bacterium]|nr:GNAT family N-acetyltransferase [Anaerolineaceae bacterium]HPN51981.1 GNAT family N-acetyltransferase [Anaerolineaceae bacterium]
MTELKIQFFKEDDISASLKKQIHTVNDLAFSTAGPEDPKFDHITWSESEWAACGLIEDTLVTFFAMLKRQVTAGGVPVWVAGIGGVSTHPDWQRRGYARQLLRAAVPVMRDTIGADFGLLLCEDHVVPVYASCGWQVVGSSFLFSQPEMAAGERRRLITCVMALPLTGEAWPEGEIDFCGLPW